MSVAIRPDLVDLLIDLYCDWRMECAEVRAAYARFSNAPPADRAVTFAAYAAALDREESACDAYAAQTRAIQTRSNDTGTRPHRRTIHRA